MFTLWLKAQGESSSGSVAKNLPASPGDTGNVGSIPGLGRSHEGGKGNPLQYPCQQNPIDRGSIGSQRVGHNWMTERANIHAKHMTLSINVFMDGFCFPLIYFAKYWLPTSLVGNMAVSTLSASDWALFALCLSLLLLQLVFFLQLFECCAGRVTPWVVPSWSRCLHCQCEGISCLITWHPPSPSWGWCCRSCWLIILYLMLKG